jgi:uncharacterized RDD family membrane protein YckC
MSSEYRGFADQLNIETPEQVDLRFPVAGLGSRFVAVLIDHLLQFFAYFLIFLIFVVFATGAAAHHGARGGNTNFDTAGKWFIAVIIFLVFCLQWGYFALFEAFWKGQTPGKRIMKLRVIKDSGRQITLFESMARNLIRIVDALPSMYFVGVITMLCNKKSKRLGDLAAGTLVVHEMPPDNRLTDAFTSGEDFFARRDEAQPQPETGLPSDAIARLDPQDLHVMETFFTRALDLDLNTRFAMATRIVAKMSAKMKVPVPEGNPERALEQMAKAMRGTGRRF